MTTLYTSHATSLALRDAGAPQGNCERYWCPNDLSMQRLDPRGYDHEHCPSWRADELIEALREAGYTVGVMAWGETVDVRATKDREMHASAASSLVEALAAAWLQILKEEKR